MWKEDDGDMFYICYSTPILRDDGDYDYDDPPERRTTGYVDIGYVSTNNIFGGF